MHPHPDFTDLRLMIHVAEASSLSHAAEKSNLSTPAASNRIRALESRVGVQLLYRESRGVTLTPSGEAFVRHARIILQQLERLTSDLQAFGGGGTGHVRLWANATSVEFLPPAFECFLATHPNVDVELRERLSFDILRAVIQGRADIGLVASNVESGEVQLFPFREDRLVLVTSESHPFAGCEAIAFERTLDADFVGLPEASAIHGFLANAARALGRTLHLRIEVPNLEACCRMIEAGVGIGIVPESTARRHARSLAIRIVPLSDEWAVRRIRICVRNLDELPAFARELVECLREVPPSPRTGPPVQVTDAEARGEPSRAA